MIYLTLKVADAAVAMYSMRRKRRRRRRCACIRRTQTLSTHSQRGYFYQLLGYRPYHHEKGTP